MKNYKRILAILMAAAMLATSVSPNAYAADVTDLGEAAEDAAPADDAAGSEAQAPSVGSDVQTPSAENVEAPAQDAAGIEEENSDDEDLELEEGEELNVEELTVPDVLPEHEKYTLPNDGLTEEDLYERYVADVFGFGGISAYSIPLRDRLTGTDRDVYDLISAKYKKIASGEETDTMLDIPISIMLPKTSFTEADLGVPIVVTVDGKPAINSAAIAAIKGMVHFDSSKVMDAVYADHPYEQYWVQKFGSSPMSISGFGYGASYSAGNWTLEVKSGYSIVTQVTEAFRDVTKAPYTAEYSDGSTQNFYHYTDAAKTGASLQAVNRAMSIIAAAAGLSDYEKLKYYKDQICDLVEYNTPAAADSWDMSDVSPWMIMNVFDGDPSTDVVCEGYAKAFQYLCDHTAFNGDVYCYSVIGGIPGAHMWNLVHMDDGEVYLVDVTNCDSGKIGAPYYLFLKAPSGGSVNSGYTFTFPWGQKMTYTYDAGETLPYYSTEELTLADHDYTEPAPCEHVEVTIPEVPATCTEAGLTSGVKCSVCDKVLVPQEAVPAKGHKVVTDAGREATCLTTGLTEGKRCSVCKEVLQKQEMIPAKGHTEVIIPGKEATCTEDGVTEGKTCSVCHVYMNLPEKIPAKGHTEVILERKEATCTEDGLVDGKYCSVCKEVLVAQEVIPAKGHTEVIDEGKAATCTEAGLTEGKHCSVCKEVLVSQEEIPAKDHTEITISGREATCLTTGLTDGKYCSVCKTELQKQEMIPAKGHTEVIIPGKAATCTEDGVTEGKTCSVCHVYMILPEKIPAKGHTEVIDEAVKATCTTAGKTEGKHCSVCNEVLKAQEEIPATGHKEDILEAKEATCTETGLTEGKKCSVCDEILKMQEIVPAKGHKEATEPGREATCLTTGLTDGKYCSVCKEVLEERKPIPAKGHTEVIIPGKAATCTEDGVTEGKTCSVCHVYMILPEKIPAKGHTEVIDEAVKATCTTAGKTEGKHCSVCNEVLKVQEEIPATGHKEEILEGKEATCTETGLTEGKKCSVCDEILAAQEVIPAEGHDYVNGVCTKCDTVMDLSVRYNTHMQTYGWRGWSEAGNTSGVIGEAKRMESLKIEITGNDDGNGGKILDGGIKYQTHVQTYGWLKEVKDGQMSGTTGEAKRVEALRINLYGEIAEYYDVYYRAYAQSYGWLGWAKNGQSAGTAGYAYRLEGIQIVLVPKGDPAPGSTANAFRNKAGHTHEYIYDSHVAADCTHAESNILKCFCGSTKNETVGSAAPGHKYTVIDQAEATCTAEGYTDSKCTVCGDEKKEVIPALGHDYVGVVTKEPTDEEDGVMTYTCSRCEDTYTEAISNAVPHTKYRTHVQTYGDQKWKYDGDMSGTSGQAKRLEGIWIELIDENGNPYDTDKLGVEYRTHVQTFGWEKTWRQNGEMSGTSGLAKRLEAIEIRLTGADAEKYDIYYCVHAQHYGWLGWAKNGESAGTAGYAYRLEGIKIIVQEKGLPAPPLEGTRKEAFKKK